jgi:hypothetical protein
MASENPTKRLKTDVPVIGTHKYDRIYLRLTSN